jgi:hypothetical protein
VPPSPALAGSPPGPGFDAAWARALAELELDADRADAVLAAVRAGREVPQDWHGTWAPPRDLGPLPASLADRARALLDRQIRTGHALAQACALTTEQVRRGERMSGSARQPAVPVFIDATA